jgi:inorganic phosphate transporter, PiT family
MLLLVVAIVVAVAFDGFHESANALAALAATRAARPSQAVALVAIFHYLVAGVGFEPTTFGL